MWATKYRPVKLDDVLGQDIMTQAIRNTLSTNNIASTYLVSGNYGGGKTTSFRIFAKALTCPEVATGEGCGVCSQCKEIDDRQGNNNYQELDAASNGNVDDIRRIIHESNKTVTGKARRRVLLLDECHQLSKTAQNALLKLLEEGSPSTTYMLATTDVEKILPTITSRCIKWKIRNPSIQDVKKRLCMIAGREKVTLDDDAAETIAKVSKGHVRDAITLLEQMSMMGHVTLSQVSDYLELDRDKDVAETILNLATNQDKAYEQIEVILGRMTPEGYWSAVRRILSEALRVRKMGEQGHMLQSILDTINSTYGEQVSNTVEWILSQRLQPSTVTEILCVISMLQNRLIPNKKETVLETRKAAVPFRFREEERVTQMPLSVDTFLNVAVPSGVESVNSAGTKR